MGYRVDRRVVLVLEDMDGAECSVCIGVPLAALRAWDLSDTITAEWGVFLEHARPEWNLEDGDGPVPADADAVERLPLPVSRAVMTAWRRAAVEPPPPLPPTSSGGTA